MSRAEENRKLIEHLETEAEKIDEGFDEVMELAYIYNILADISKSLAEISDKMGKGIEEVERMKGERDE